MTDSPSVTERAAAWLDQVGVVQVTVDILVRDLLAELVARDRRDRYIPDATLALADAAVEVADVLPEGWTVEVGEFDEEPPDNAPAIFAHADIVGGAPDFAISRLGDVTRRHPSDLPDDIPDDADPRSWEWLAYNGDLGSRGIADTAADAARAALHALGADQ